MALKFLNKKGWHTGSLRNIENVWKAEQKHEAEQRKLEELRKQIQEERERAEFRLLQERAGLVPRQERLDFLYESGLAVGKGSSEGFKVLEGPPKAETSTAASEPSSSKAAVPGALFEDKPQSANDSWRKLHSDPLLLIRQREQEAIARIKNNPIQMAMIKKSVEAEKPQKEKSDKRKKKKEHKKHRHSKSKHDKHLTEHGDSEDLGQDREEKSDRSRSRHHHGQRDHEEDGRRGGRSVSEYHSYNLNKEEERRAHPSFESHRTGFDWKGERTERITSEHHGPGSNLGSKSSHRETQISSGRQDSGYTHHRKAPRLSEEERAARIQEMQLDAEVHEEWRWKRIKKASEADAREAITDGKSSSGNFLDAAKKSLFGTEKGGSSTIEESIRRRSYYSQGGAAAGESNAFRRQ